MRKTVWQNKIVIVSKWLFFILHCANPSPEREYKSKLRNHNCYCFDGNNLCENINLQDDFKR